MYNVLLCNYRVTRVVENFKEGKQMSHNKILRTVLVFRQERYYLV